MVFIKIILILALMIVLLQDIKERQVYWFLFPIIGLFSGILLYVNTFPLLFYTTVSINIAFVGVLIGVVFLYSKLKLKTSISHTFGLGDGLLFFFLAFTFSSISFLVLFVFGLLFSLVLHLLMKQKTKQETVPLAGYLSLYFAVIYLSHWAGIFKSVYTI